MASTGNQSESYTLPAKCLTLPAELIPNSKHDLECGCKIDNHIASNYVFASDCLLKESTDVIVANVTFVKGWIEFCRRVGKDGGHDIPRGWKPDYRTASQCKQPGMTITLQNLFWAHYSFLSYNDNPNSQSPLF
ncbi:hypothetical protein E8E13_011561 [Curvularia kusanoi]|uniref:Uncharacterized protein n=1 Tax=Curvularia kusanoi TaxID=90978 RepID=A0A9P4WBS4_CURKU|nr:hypothetical protein E8E13_011561 [Curvularia kusanoi]